MICADRQGVAISEDPEEGDRFDFLSLLTRALTSLSDDPLLCSGKLMASSENRLGPLYAISKAISFLATGAFPDGISQGKSVYSNAELRYYYLFSTRVLKFPPITSSCHRRCCSIAVQGWRLAATLLW